MTSTCESAPCLRLPSFDMQGICEGASILGSIRGSREHISAQYTSSLATAPASCKERAEDLMSAPSYFLASFAHGCGKSMGDLVGSAEALHTFVGTDDNFNDPEAADSATDLPLFPRRSSLFRFRRSDSVSRSQDAWVGQRLNSTSWDLVLPPLTSRSSEDRTKTFLELIDVEIAVTPTAASSRNASSIAAIQGENVQHVAHQDGSQPSTTAAGDQGAQERGNARAKMNHTRATSTLVAPLDPFEDRAVRKRGVGGKKRSIDQGSGTHVRDRPDMQKRARLGQEHWLAQVKQVRKEWRDRREWENKAEYKNQVETCAQLQIKSQHECLLRTLHMASTDGLIVPSDFVDCGPDSFLGWTGFTVVQDRAQEFRKRVDQLFPQPLKENTLHTSFRRAGLVPDKWSSGWLGLTPFRYSNEKRVAYAPTLAAAAAATKKK